MIKTIKINLIDQQENKEIVHPFYIEYLNCNQEEAFYIEKLVLENLYTFSDLFSGLDKISFIESSSSTTLHIDSLNSLKSYLTNKIPSYMDKVTEPLRREDRYLSEAVLLKVLLLDLYKSLDLDVDIPNSIEQFNQHVNAVYTLIAADYYSTDPNKFLNFLFNIGDEEEKRKLFNYLNDKSRFSLLNVLLQEQYKILIKLDEESETKDNLLYSHLDEIIEILEQDLIETPILEQISSYQFPSLSKESLHNLCLEFFQSLDPSGKYKKIYQRLHDNQIVYIEKDEQNKIDWCNYRDEENGYIIIAPLNEKITDFRDLVHEVTHLLSLEQLDENEIISPSLLEFPSIFMELQAIKFLRKKGYPQEVLDSLYVERNVWTAENILTISPILRTLSRYLKQGQITAATEQEYALTTIGDTSNLTEEEKELLNQYIPYELERILDVCDQKNDFLIMHPNAILRQYPYAIGKYLAVKTMDKELENPNIVQEVLIIIENLKNETPEGVLKKLDLDVIKNSETAKEYIKTRPQTV